MPGKGKEGGKKRAKKDRAPCPRKPETRRTSCPGRVELEAAVHEGGRQLRAALPGPIRGQAQATLVLAALQASARVGWDGFWASPTRTRLGETRRPGLEVCDQEACFWLFLVALSRSCRFFFLFSVDFSVASCRLVWSRIGGLVVEAGNKSYPLQEPGRQIRIQTTNPNHPVREGCLTGLLVSQPKRPQTHLCFRHDAHETICIFRKKPRSAKYTLKEAGTDKQPGRKTVYN